MGFEDAVASEKNGAQKQISYCNSPFSWGAESTLFYLSFFRVSDLQLDKWGGQETEGQERSNLSSLDGEPCCRQKEKKMGRKVMEGVELESWRVVELPVPGKATLGYLFS